MLSKWFYTLSKIIMTKLLSSDTAGDVVLFNDEKIRRERYNNEWYFSVVDIVNILSSSKSKDK